MYGGRGGMLRLIRLHLCGFPQPQKPEGGPSKGIVQWHSGTSQLFSGGDD